MQHFFLSSSQPAGEWLESGLLLGTSSHHPLSPCSRTLLTPVTWAMSHESNASKSVLSNFTVLQNYLEGVPDAAAVCHKEVWIGRWGWSVRICISNKFLGSSHAVVTVWKLIYLMVKRKLFLLNFPVSTSCSIALCSLHIPCLNATIQYFHSFI